MQNFFEGPKDQFISLYYGQGTAESVCTYLSRYCCSDQMQHFFIEEQDFKGNKFSRVRSELHVL